MKMKAFVLSLALFVLISSFALGETVLQQSSFTSDEMTAATYVYDYAGLFSAEDVEILDAAIAEFQENTGYNFAILITAEDNGYDDYDLLCDDFFTEQDLGRGMNDTAILCYLDLYGGMHYHIRAYGDLAYLMVIDDIYTLLNGAQEYFNEANYPGGFLWTIDMLNMALPNIGTADQTKRVFDFVEILSEEETAELEAAIAQFRALSGMDFLYLSTYVQMNGNSNGEYMDEFYLRHGFGEGDNRNGAGIYLDVNLDTLYFNYYIRNYGNMDENVSQEALNGILDSCKPFMDEGKIAEAVLQIISDYSAYFQ